MPRDLPIDYATASAGALAAALRARQVSALELFETAVAAIGAKDGPINAVVIRDFDRARDAALAADAALARGEDRPLLGVPMTVKEAHRMEGLPTTWGIAPFKGWMAKADATGVQRLKQAGAVILGKTNVPPGLGDWQSDNPIYGRTNHPLDLDRTPGGSSGGGAAALAAGMVPLEYGSDIGGSIRIPAHFCGVFGHKPTFGLIPPTGHTPPPIEASGEAVQFGVVGPLARTAADLDLALAVLAGPDGDMARGYRLQPPPSRLTGLKGARVLVLSEHPAAAVDAEVLAPLERLARNLEGAGAEVERRSALLPDLLAAHDTYVAMTSAILTRGARMAPGGSSLPPPIDAHAWMSGLDAIVRHRRQWAQLFERFDVVLAPPFGTAAFRHFSEGDDVVAEIAFPGADPGNARKLVINGAETPYGAQLHWASIATFPGLPSTCAPIGRTAGGLPVGVQIIGPLFGDHTTIAVAGLIEREYGVG